MGTVRQDYDRWCSLCVIAVALQGERQHEVECDPPKVPFTRVLDLDRSGTRT
jgi:hypothetical protein